MLTKILREARAGQTLYLVYDDGIDSDVITASDNNLSIQVAINLRGVLNILTDESGNILTDELGNILVDN